jgi:hypothetical protein
VKIIISKELKKFMSCAKQITEIEDKETWFYINYFDLVRICFWPIWRG